MDCEFELMKLLNTISIYTKFLHYRFRLKPKDRPTVPVYSIDNTNFNHRTFPTIFYGDTENLMKNYALSKEMQINNNIIKIVCKK